MKHLFIISLITLSGCVYKISATQSYWIHSSKTDSTDEYQKCRKLHDKNKEKLGMCMNKKGWKLQTIK